MSDEFQKLLEELHKAQKEENKEKEVQAELKIAEFHYNNSDYSKAKRTLESILKLDPSYKNINYYLALIALHESKDVSKALNYLDEELKRGDNKDAKSLREKLQVHSRIPIITLSLILMFVLTYFLASLQNFPFSYLLLYSINSQNILFGNVLSSIFVHFTLLHLITNSLLLLFLGLVFEKFVGSLKLLLIFLLSAIVGNLTESLLLIDNGFVLGASAGIFGIFGGLLMREPLMSMRLFGLIKIPLILLLGFFFTGSFLLTEILSPFGTGGAVIGNVAHLFGFLTGVFLTGVLYRETISTFYYWLTISAGFWCLLISFSIPLDIGTIQSYFLRFIILFTGILLVAISYFQLKKIRGSSLKEKSK